MLTGWLVMPQRNPLLTLTVQPALIHAHKLRQFGIRASWFDDWQQRDRDGTIWPFMAVGSFTLMLMLEEWLFGVLLLFARSLAV